MPRLGVEGLPGTGDLGKIYTAIFIQQDLFYKNMQSLVFLERNCSFYF